MMKSIIYKAVYFYIKCVILYCHTLKTQVFIEAELIGLNSKAIIIISFIDKVFVI